MRVPLSTALIAFAAASLAHHLHNAEYLDEYPNMPAWLSRAGVYTAWIVATAVAVAGYLLLRGGYRIAGIVLLILYCGYGLNVLVHYALAPLAAHSAAMNLTIWLEAAAALVLLAVVAKQ
jgi:hypothetical protein